MLESVKKDKGDIPEMEISLKAVLDVYSIVTENDRFMSQ